MKQFIFSLFFTPVFFVSAQKKSKSKIPLVFYLDSVRVKPTCIFDLDKIESVTEIIDDDTTARGGKVFMKSKDPSGFRLLTPKEIFSIYHVTPDSPAILMVNDRVIRDTGDFQIDSFYIATIKFTDIDRYSSYNGKQILDLRFLKIQTWGYLEEQSKKRKKKKSKD